MNIKIEYLIQQRKALDNIIWWVVVAYSNLTNKYIVEGKYKTKKEAEYYRDKLEKQYIEYMEVKNGN